MKDYSRFYNELNDAQKKAVDTVRGPLLVIAGPGTGKTQLLSVRAASIISKEKVPADSILVLTYTNSAARSMKERLAEVMGVEGYDVEVDTFHSFANSVIQQSEEAANYIGDRIQMTDVERVRAMQHILDNTDGLDEIRPIRAPYMYINEVLAKISGLKRDGITPDRLDAALKDRKALEAALKEDKHVKRIDALSKVYRLYEALKAGRDKRVFDERGRYDFDDMVIYATEALRKEKSLKSRYSQTYKYAMVDEYQDTNLAQLEFLFTLFEGPAANIACVGDDDQSIYRFQGASVKNFRLLEERLPGLVTISLEDNYRSSRELIDVSSAVINLIPATQRVSVKKLMPVSKQKSKEIEFRELSTEREEILYIIEKIKALKESASKDKTLNKEERGRPYNNIAVLVRKRSDILKLIDAFLAAGIPYATDGKEDISGERRVKQMLDVLTLANLGPSQADDRDLAFFKVISSDYFRIPPADILKFIGYVNAKKAGSGAGRVSILQEFAVYFSSGFGDIKFSERIRIETAYLAITNLLRDASTRPVHALLMDYIKESGVYAFLLEEFTDNDILRIRELRALTSFVNMVKSSDVANPSIRLADFIAEIRTRQDHGLPIQGQLVTMTQDGVRIYTAHGAKGQEFRSVIIPFCLQNKNWPSKHRYEKIPMPEGIAEGHLRCRDKEAAKDLFGHDETRLFYVAVTRAKSNLIFTASPNEGAVSSYYLDKIAVPRSVGAMRLEEDLLGLSLEVSDRKDPLIGTTTVMKDLVSNLTLNPTRLNSYISCQRKFFYNDVLKIPGSKKRGLVFGNCVHKALEVTYNEYRRNKSFPAFKIFRDAFEMELDFQGVDKTIKAQCLNPDQMKKLKNWFDLASKNPIIPLGLEKKLTITVGDGIIFTGKYDKIEWDDESRNLVRILDYKTGKPDDHLKAIAACGDLASDECDGYLRQLVAYKLLYEKDRKESQGRKASSGSLVFIEPLSADIRKAGYKKGDHATKTVSISDAMVSSLEEVIKDIWKKIKGLKFDRLKKRDNKICGMCDFDSICWSGCHEKK